MPPPKCATVWTGSAAIDGGRGAVREFIELVLRAQGRWDGVTRDYFEKG